MGHKNIIMGSRNLVQGDLDLIIFTLNNDMIIPPKKTLYTANWTPTNEWCMTRFVVRKRHQTHKGYDEIGICA